MLLGVHELHAKQHWNRHVQSRAIDTRVLGSAVAAAISMNVCEVCLDFVDDSMFRYIPLNFIDDSEFFFFFRYNLVTQSWSTTYMLCACVSRHTFTCVQNSEMLKVEESIGKV